MKDPSLYAFGAPLRMTNDPCHPERAGPSFVILSERSEPKDLHSSLLHHPGKAAEGFYEVVHEVPLESLQDVFSFEELEEFDRRVREIREDCLPRIEAVSAAVTERLVD